MNKTSSQTIVEIPAGGFYVHDTTNPNILPYSDGAFGCCYLIIEDPISKKTVIAHINAQTVMFEPIADKTVKNMLAEFKKHGGNIARSKVTIVHSNKFEEYEEAQSKKTESFKLTNSYKEKTENNMVMEPFANEFLERALERAGLFGELQIHHAKEFRLLSRLIKGEEDPQNWTEICFANLDTVYNYVQKNGWNFNSPQAEMAAFLMTQHGDAGLFGFTKNGEIDGSNEQLQKIIDKQKFILGKIKESELIKENQSTELIAAFVEDRTLRNECKEQKYGTQRLFKNTPTYPENVDDNRANIGFKETCEEYHIRTQNDPLTYKEILDHNDRMKGYIENLESRKIMPSIIINDKFNSNLIDFVANPMVGTKKTDICFVDGKIHLQNYHSNQCPNKEEWLKPENERNWKLWKSEVKEHTVDSDKAFEKVSLAQKNGTAITISGGDWKAVHNFYLTLREGIDTNQIKQDGTNFDFSEIITKEFKEKMNSNQFIVVNMNNVVKEHLQSHFKQPTISSLLKGENDILPQISSTFKNKQGEIVTVSNKKQDKSFVEALKERREKEAKSSKGQSK